MRIVLALLCLFAASEGRAAAKVEYPVLRQLEGAATVRQKGEVLKGRLPGRLLREQILVETGKGRVRLDLSASEFVIVGENSEFLMPAIDWDTGTVEELELRRGSFGVELKRPRQVRAALYRDRVEEGRYIFDFNPDIPQFGATVLAGKLAFRGLETEERGELRAGERQSFTGEIADGQIQYDVLLGGRKVARGRLGEKQSVKPADLAAFNRGFELGRPKAAAKPKDPAAAAGAGGGVCRQPAGRFNDCAFTCENNPKGRKVCDLENPKVRCVRRRCLASGQWGDEFVFAKHLAVCEAGVFVRPCDY